MPADLDPDHADDLPAGVGDDRLLGSALELRCSCFEIDRRLRGDARALLRHGSHEHAIA